MGLSTAERNKRKRERKKLEREEQRKKEQEAKEAAKATEKVKQGAEPAAADDDDVNVEIEYVAEPLAPDAIEAVQGLDRLAQMQQEQEQQQQQQRRDSSAVVSDDEKNNRFGHDNDDDEEKDDDDNESNNHLLLSKRRLREKIRPSVADLKRRVPRPDLVEAHDVTAPNPDFLVQLKAAPGTVPVPRHWGRKRKYLQGKVRCFSSIFVCI
jgi:splicing factor 3B subunit 2